MVTENRSSRPRNFRC